MKAQEMEGVSEYTDWAELLPDALGLVFRNLSLKEMLTVVPRVCKAWNRVVNGPYCWQEIDIEEWSNQCNIDYTDRMVRMLITRSAGSLRKLSVSSLQKDSTFTFIGEHAGSLQTLKISRSEISDTVIEKVAPKLSNLTDFDLSYCCKIGVAAFEAIGKNCKHLISFNRNMHPIDTADILSQDEEVEAIANSMPNLKCLEIAYNRISTECVQKVLKGCTKLEFLELRGCWDVELDQKLITEKYPKLKVVGPHIRGYYNIVEWEDCSDYYSDGSEYLAWELLEGPMEYEDADDDEEDFNEDIWNEDEANLENLEFQFYEAQEGLGRGAGWPAWPPSP